MSVNTLKRYGRILDSICQRMIKRAGGHGYLWLKSGIMMDNKSIGYYMRYDLKFNVPDITLDDLVCIEIKDRIWVAIPLDRMSKKKSDRPSYTWEIDTWSGQWQLCEEFVKAIEL